MKHALAILAAASMFAVHALAQYSVETLTHGIVTVPPAGTSNVVGNAAIDTSDTLYTAIRASFVAADDSGATNNVTLTFRPSMLAGTGPTTTANDWTWAISTDGTNTVRAETNVASYGWGWLKLLSIANAAGTNITNIAITYTVKKP